MSTKPTLNEICDDKQLWMTYVDPSGVGTVGESGDEFDRMTLQERMEFCKKCGFADEENS